MGRYWFLLKIRGKQINSNQRSASSLAMISKYSTSSNGKRCPGIASRRTRTSSPIACPFWRRCARSRPESSSHPHRRCCNVCRLSTTLRRALCRCVAVRPCHASHLSIRWRQRAIYAYRRYRSTGSLRYAAPLLMYSRWGHHDQSVSTSLTTTLSRCDTSLPKTSFRLMLSTL